MRNPLDFYETPDWAVKELLRVWTPPKRITMLQKLFTFFNRQPKKIIYQVFYGLRSSDKIFLQTGHEIESFRELSTDEIEAIVYSELPEDLRDTLKIFSITRK